MKVEPIRIQPVGEFWLVEVAVNGMRCPAFYDHKSHSEPYKTAEEWLGYLGDQALALAEAMPGPC